MAELAPLPRYRFEDNNGEPLDGGLLYTYEAGTSTPRTTYKDVAGVEPNTNPVVLDSAGRAQVRIVSGSYKFVLKDANDVTIWTEDNVQSIADLINVAGALAVENNLDDVADLPTALTNLGLDSVDNTSDADKPVSTATQTALDLKAPLASPTFTGTVAGITKSMVGLGNVDNTSDATKNAATATLTNKTTTNLVLNGTAGGTAVLDEDDMSSNSATKLATQQSIKAYVDSVGGTGLSSEAKSSSFTAVTGKVYLISSASAVTVTLPSASSNANAFIYLYKTSTDFNAITAGPTAIHTSGERLTLFSDGTSWVVFDRRVPSIWTAYTPGTFQGMGTVSSDLEWRRNSQNLEVRGEFTIGTPSATLGYFSFPNSAMDAVTKSSSYSNAGSMFQSRSGTSEIKHLNALSYDGDSQFYLSTSHYAVTSDPNSGQTGSTVLFTSGRVMIGGVITARINGWNG